jgi:hypothetical protein
VKRISLDYLLFFQRLFELGLRVLICSHTHSAVDNLLAKVIEAAPDKDAFKATCARVGASRREITEEERGIVFELGDW